MVRWPTVLLVAVLGCGGGGDHGSDRSSTTPTPSAASPTVTSTPTPAALRAFAVGALRFEAAGGVSILRSEDAGSTWRRAFGSETFGPLGLRLAFADGENGWVIDGTSGASSRIFHTVDGGSSWSNQSENIVSVAKIIELQDLAFLSLERGVAVGATLPDPPVGIAARPLILVTNDGGDRWSPATVRLTPDRPGALTSVCLTTSGLGIAVGSSAVSGVVVVRTTDGGETWLDITSRLTLSSRDLASLSTVGCAEPMHFWVGGTDFTPTILFSSDGGATWVDHSPALPRRFDDASLAVMFVDATRGWVMVVGSLVILHTEDAGATWAAQAPPETVGGSLTAIDFADAFHGVVVGYGDPGGGLLPALILTTQDGGATWVPASIGTGDVVGLEDVCLLP